MHSCYSSDSKSRLRDILSTIKKNGLGGVAITDHNSVDGAVKAVEIGRGMGIIVIRGIEITSAEGHILAYGVGEKLPNKLSPEETIEEIESLGGISVIPHPYRRISGIGGKIARSLRPSAIETLNARSPAGENARAMKLAEALDTPQTGGSDAHELEYLGNAYTLFPSGLVTEEELLEALRKGKARTGGRSTTVKEIVRYYTKITTNWTKRGFKRI